MPFDTLGLDKRLLEGVRDLGYKETRPIQSAVIPLALGGNDLIACAETGTGKTAAFVLPTLQKLLTTPPAMQGGQTPGSDPVQNLPRSRVLVLAPTRELAVQIEDEMHGLAYHTADHERGGVRRRRDGAAGTGAQGRRRHHRGHARSADGPHAAAERGPHAASSCSSSTKPTA